MERFRNQNEATPSTAWNLSWAAICCRLSSRRNLTGSLPEIDDLTRADHDQNRARPALREAIESAEALGRQSEARVVHCQRPGRRRPADLARGSRRPQSHDETKPKSGPSFRRSKIWSSICKMPEHRSVSITSDCSESFQRRVSSSGCPMPISNGDQMRCPTCGAEQVWADILPALPLRFALASRCGASLSVAPPAVPGRPRGRPDRDRSAPCATDCTSFGRRPSRAGLLALCDLLA